MLRASDVITTAILFVCLTRRCVTVRCLAVLPQCRVEGNPQNRMQFRVTVAAPDAALASSVKDMIVAQIMAVP